MPLMSLMSPHKGLSIEYGDINKMHNNQLNLNGSTALSRPCPGPRIENTNILNVDTTILRTLVHFSFLHSILFQPFRGCLSLLYNIYSFTIPAGRIEPRRLYVADIVVLFSTLINLHPRLRGWIHRHGEQIAP